VSPANQRMQRVFREVFENDDLLLTDDMSQSTMADWDSFAHIKLIIGLQEEFGVRFTTDEVADVGNVLGIRAIIEARA